MSMEAVTQRSRADRRFEVALSSFLLQLDANLQRNLGPDTDLVKMMAKGAVEAADILLAALERPQ